MNANNGMRFEDSWSYLVFQNTPQVNTSTIPKQIQKITNMIDNKTSIILNTKGSNETKLEDSGEVLLNL